jgi:hypothetical protein
MKTLSAVSDNLIWNFLNQLVEGLVTHHAGHSITRTKAGYFHLFIRQKSEYETVCEIHTRNINMICLKLQTTYLLREFYPYSKT